MNEYIEKVGSLRNVRNEKGVILISIATVVYNDVANFEATILSTLNQSYKNIEYLIIDGGSTDGTVDLIKKYNDSIDYWISEPDNGIYDAMNKALKIANGDFLIFMNSGDSFFSTDALVEVAHNIHDLNAIYYGNAIYLNSLTSEQFQRGGIFNKYRLAKTNICHQTIFFSKKVYKSVSYNLRYKLFADWAYNMVLFNKHNYIYLNLNIAYYDTSGVSALKKDRNFENDLKKLILKHLGIETILYLLYNKIRNFKK